GQGVQLPRLSDSAPRNILDAVGVLYRAGSDHLDSVSDRIRLADLVALLRPAMVVCYVQSDRGFSQSNQLADSLERTFSISTFVRIPSRKGETRKAVGEDKTAKWT